MKKWMVLIAILFPATITYANPTAMPNPLSWVKAVIFYGSCFGVEVLLITTILFFCHMAVVPSLIVLFIGNILMYFFIFRPVLSATGNVLTSEVVIITVEGTFIKILSSFDSFRLDDFKGLKWITAFIIAMVGNLLSYYSGIVIVG